MASALAILGVVALVAALATLGVLVYRHEKKRQAAFADLASRLGLGYAHDGGHPTEEFRRLEGMRAPGHSHHLLDVLQGRYKERDVWCGDLRYVVEHGSGKNRSQSTHYRGFAMARVPASWPGLTIENEHIGLKIADALGADDIDFESEEFSSKFWVRSGDRKFAHDLIHPRSMELLLANRGWHWEVRAGWLAIWKQDRHKPEAIQPELDLVCAFLALVPSYVAEARG